MKKITTTLVSMLLIGGVYSQSWSVFPDAVPALGRYDDIFFLDVQSGWAVTGGNGTVYKTTDGGQNWMEQFTTTTYFRNIEFLNHDIGFVGTLEEEFYRTTDGGDNWELVALNPHPPAICGLDAVGTSTIYGCGAYFAPAYIIKSSDSGVNWEYIDMSAYARALVEILFIDEQTGYVSGNSSTGGVILKTTDGGYSWTELFNSNTTGDFVWKLQLLENNTHIYGSIQSNVQGKLVKSTDSGQTWEMKPFVDNWVQAVGFISPLHGWMGGHSTGFYETTDGGDTWNFLGIGSNLNRIVVLSPDLAYAAGGNLYWFGKGLSVNTITESDKKALSVVLAPNPVKDELKISIDFQHSDNLVAELYDESGRFVKELTTDKIEQEGSREYVIEFPYPPGVYSINIHTNNGRRSLGVIKQ